MDDEQKHQTVHILPKGKATTKFREQHAKSTKKSPSSPTGQFTPKQRAANANGFSGSIEQQLDAVLTARLKGISNPKLRKVIEESVREEALKKLAKIMPGEVARAVEASIAEISKSLGGAVPRRPASPSSPSSYGGKNSPSSGGKSSPSPSSGSGSKTSPGAGGKNSSYGGKSSPPPPPPPRPRSRGYGGKSSPSHGGK